MNRPAINDLLSGILSGWCESVAEWMPPGHATGRTCQSCRSSLLADAIDVAEWPHDLMHQLATLLETTTLQAYDSLSSNAVTYQSVRDYLAERVRFHAPDLLDVLGECAAPRLDTWSRLEVERGLADANLLH